MPRVATRSTSSNSRASTPWRTAAIAPPRPQDLITTDLALIRGPYTPAEHLLSLLMSGSGTAWGEATADPRPNITLKFFIETSKTNAQPGDFFEDLPTYTLNVSLEPGLYMKIVTVVLDSYTVGDVDAPGAPLWLRNIPRGGRTRYRAFVRRYLWVYHFIQTLLATPDLPIPYLDSWFQLLEPVAHVKKLYDTPPRRAACRVRPRPARRSVDGLVGALERMTLVEDMEGVEELGEKLHDIHI